MGIQFAIHVVRPGFSQLMNKALVADCFRYDPTGCLRLLNIFRDGK